MAAQERRREPQLHVLKLHENPVENDDYEKLSWKWMLVVETNDEAVEDDKNKPNNKTVLQFGDVLFFPELLTGAGEFEGMRFLGQEVNQNDDDAVDVDGSRPTTNRTPTTTYHLLPGGIESPEFPAIVLERYDDDRDALRASYEPLFDAILKSQGMDSFQDAMGGSTTDIERYWSLPPTLRLRKQYSTEEWRIPLSQCQIVQESTE